MIADTDGRIDALSRDEATWIVALMKAVPDLAPMTAFLLAGGLVQGHETSPLQEYLALAPWRSPENEKMYRRQVESANKPGITYGVTTFDVAERE